MPDKKIPMCGKCASKIMEQVDNNSQRLVGCSESNSIFNYDDAKVYCPLLRDPNKVLIIINQGAAQLEYKPDNVVVEIRDYDVEGDWDEDNIGCKVDHEGCRYQEMIFPAEDIDLGNENEKVTIGWQPHEDDFPIAGLMTFEVYEDLEMGEGCHPEVKNWIEIFEGMIEKPVIIPAEKKELTDEPIKFINYYRCPDCNIEWQDEWSCACDDECPVCAISYSPYMSVDINKEKTLTILYHDISYSFVDDSTIDSGDSEYEHINYMITEGYKEGELNKTDPKDENLTIRGYWKMV
jgi:hypothetical protein